MSLMNMGGFGRDTWCRLARTPWVHCCFVTQRGWFFISTRLVSCLKLKGKRYFSLSCRTEEKTDNFLDTTKLWCIYVVFHYASSEKSPLEVRISGKIVGGSLTTPSSKFSIGCPRLLTLSGNCVLSHPLVTWSVFYVLKSCTDSVV